MSAQRTMSEITRSRRWLLNVLGFFRIAFHAFRKDQAQLLAAALAYRTIFSLIPLLVLVVIVIGVVGGDEVIDQPKSWLLDYFGVSMIQTPGGIDVIALGGGQSEAANSVADFVEGLIDRVQGLNFAAIGAVGVLVLIYAALSLLTEIERAFNTVYGAPRGRRVIARLTNYWTVLTLGPIGLVAGFYITKQFGAALGDGEGTLGFVVSGVGRVLTFIISWLVLLLVYSVMPNTRVHKRAALLGAFVAALLWEIGKWGFGKYLAISTSYVTFYGSLGLIPIFLLWVYVTWMVVLLGLELAYALQMTYTLGPRAALRKERVEGAFLDSTSAVVLVRVVADRFEQGKTTTAVQGADELGMAEAAVEVLLRKLADADLLRRVDDEDERGAFTLARPASELQVADVLSVGQMLARVSSPTGAWRSAETVLEAQLGAVSGQTIASLRKG